MRCGAGLNMLSEAGICGAGLNMRSEAGYGGMARVAPFIRSLLHTHLLIGPCQLKLPSRSRGIWARLQLKRVTWVAGLQSKGAVIYKDVSTVNGRGYIIFGDVYTEVERVYLWMGGGRYLASVPLS